MYTHHLNLLILQGEGISIHDFSARSVQKLLRFLYTGRVVVEDEKEEIQDFTSITSSTNQEHEQSQVSANAPSSNGVADAAEETRDDDSEKRGRAEEARSDERTRSKVHTECPGDETPFPQSSARMQAGAGPAGALELYRLAENYQLHLLQTFCERVLRKSVRDVFISRALADRHQTPLPTPN